MERRLRPNREGDPPQSQPVLGGGQAEALLWVGGSGAQTTERPPEHSRREHVGVHAQEAGQQQHAQGQEEEGPEAPVGRGTSESPGRGQEGTGEARATHSPHLSSASPTQQLLLNPCCALACTAPGPQATPPTAREPGEAKRQIHSLGGRGPDRHR